MVASVDARSGVAVAEVAPPTSAEEVGELARRAASVAPVLDRLGRHGRAEMLEAMADALESRRDLVVSLADRESALGTARLEGELTRTCFQLRFFADVLRDGAYLEATIDHSGPTPMGPRPDLRRILRPLGPVAVFGASNFPLAFSVPGGDTASALAAGCPVVSKVHDAHPATAVACAEALAEGARAAGAPDGVLSLAFGEDAGRHLVAHEEIRAVGFTGSVAGGRALAEIAALRSSPIPFYGELGALNALVVSPGAARSRASAIADGLASSFTLGVGQFCTKPGMVFVPPGRDGDALVERLDAAVRASARATMLTSRISEAFARGTARLEAAGATVRARGASEGGGTGALVLEADGAALSGAVVEECFGPVTVVVRYETVAQLRDLLRSLPGALTATVHGEPEEASSLLGLLDDLAGRVGRVIWNGFPTGVAVAWAMHHGGPWPAATDPLHTSVGASAIRRFLRPVAYQDVPDELLPPELLDAPPSDHSVPRRVDGELVPAAGRSRPRP
ncbi:MAG: aldehyde dehydrogenase (NADP(+)) [Actinomycetota bacterium]|nr:aldehyde dehydrogenase (NADP(+)) [Actinomycetota bacterium]